MPRRIQITPDITNSGEYWDNNPKSGWYVNKMYTNLQEVDQLEFKDKEGKWINHDRTSKQIRLKSNEINKGFNLLDFLSEKKITTSKSEARRTIANNGIKINNVLVIDEKRIIGLDDFKDKILSGSKTEPLLGSPFFNISINSIPLTTFPKAEYCLSK